MPIHKTQAIVLSRYDVRETSVITNFYTREYGKVTGILKGFRSDPGKFATSLQLFSLNEIIFYRKRNTNVHLVSQADLRENFDPIRLDMIKMGMASFMMELLAAVMPPEDKNEEVFDLSLSCLNEMKTAYNAEKIATIFKIKMLALSGFKPHFDSCVSCQDRVMGQSKFSLSLGGLLCPRCFTKDTTSRSIFRGTVATILHIERNDLKSNLNLGLNPQIKRELEIILNAFLNFHLEKELKSQRVVNKLTDVVPVKA
ncbi:MAG: DNA repair protein RecO [Candidatus Omnitrophica bacterium]|nr:DNA repair protein RecO [Candidatus Omnitrophota bacterium]MDD5653374.1 DNA repair protein RecO [Candidatus Omnitrophota bacterium]